MFYANFDQAALIKFLEKCGYKLNRTTIFNYTRYGYITAPIKQPNASMGGRRICYHPFTVIEILTALLLFKGDFLEQDSKFRIPRFNGSDIFLARLNMYKQSPELLSESDLFIHTTDATEYFENIHIKMDELGIDSFQRQMQKTLLSPLLNQQNEGKVKDSYLAFITDVYSLTFKFMVDKYLSKLISFINENE